MHVCMYVQYVVCMHTCMYVLQYFVSEADVRPSVDFIPNNSCEFEKPSMVEIVGDSELMTVTCKVVPFVDVHPVPLVGYDLTQKNNVHKIVLQFF